MHQVTYPITAALMNNQDFGSLKRMYQKSSLTLYIISGFIFLLILLNMQDLYLLLPAEYRGGLLVVFLIGLARVFDAVLGINNAILFNSEHYRAVLIMGMLLAVLTVLFNLWLIPVFGINGAALASLLAIVVYNSIKLFYVRKKFNMLPFTKESWKVSGLLLTLGALLYFLPLPFAPIPNIILKSGLLTAVYFGLIYRFRISEDVIGVLSSLLTRKGRR
jgi:O-antigen/teichoic acid export membrane protein